MDDKLEGARQGGEHYSSHGGLKIRKWPSSKCNTAAGANFYCKQKHLFKSFLEYGSYCIRQESKKISGPVVVKQPLIIHTVDPEIVMAEPGEFTSVVQRLTGSQDTRMALRNMKRKMKGPRSIQGRKDTSQKCALGGSTTRLTQQPLSDSNDTDVHPSSPSPAMPSSSLNSSAITSPRSGLTTSCSEGYHTDISTESYDSRERSVPANCEAPSRCNSCRAELQEQVGDYINEDEDGSSFFVFSRDCYYGNHAA